MGVIWIDSRRFVTGGGGGTDPDFANVSLLLHMDGSNGSTTFTDSSNNALTVTANGNAQISTAQSKFGGASGLFDGTGDYLDIASDAAFGFGTGDFTIEYFIRFTAAAGVAQIHVDTRISTVSETAPTIYSIGTDLYYYTDATNRITATGALTASTWHHIAVCKSGTSTRLFVDGTQVGSTYTDSNDYGASRPLVIGSYLYKDNFFVDGNFDEFRITNGVARYQSAFTPPTAAFPDS